MKSWPPRGFSRGRLNERSQPTARRALVPPDRRAVAGRGGPTRAHWETVHETTELELHDAKDATKEILKLHGAYAQPEGGEVKFLVVRDLDDVVPSN